MSRFLARLHPVADVGLRAPLRLRLGRDRVELGRIHEVDAALESEVHLGVAVRLGVLLAPRHRAEADRGNMDIGAAETALLHGALRKGLAGAWGGTPGGKPNDKPSFVLREALGSRSSVWNLGRRPAIEHLARRRSDPRICFTNRKTIQPSLAGRTRRPLPGRQGSAMSAIPSRAFVASRSVACSAIATPMAVASKIPKRWSRIRALAIPPAWTDVWISPARQRPHPGDRPRCPRPQAVPLSRSLVGLARRGQIFEPGRLCRSAAETARAHRPRI